MDAGVAGAQVDAVRQFNRFYTGHVGALGDGLLGTPFSLTQARVLFELATRDATTASEIGALLDLDAGYLSRILRGFERRKLIARKRTKRDARRMMLSLTAKGRQAFGQLDRRTRKEVAGVLAKLGPSSRTRLLGAMTTVRTVLATDAHSNRRVVVRAPRVGDIGWAIEAHGRLYEEEFGWNAEFEALVATLFARFASSHDPRCERMWVAEVDGERAGCVFVVRNEDDPNVAQLRCLLVDPSARGLGIGRRLVEECVAFARAAGYPRMILWTNDVLVSARRIYEAAGFVLKEEERHHSFGHDLVGQVWKLRL